MRQAVAVLAYHGCDESVGRSIVAGKDAVRVSTNKYDWLGTGAYFWEDSASRALQWAKGIADGTLFSRQKIKVPFVIGAIINPGVCLDLVTDDGLNILKRAYEPFVEVKRLLNEPLPENKRATADDEDHVKRELDGSLINFLHQMRKENKEAPFDTIRCAFMEGGELYRGARIYSKTHVQWCVRDPKKSIEGYFIPSEVVEAAPAKLMHSL